jgi:mRNA interferase MazF
MSMLVWMQKDFDRWNGEKSRLNALPSVFLFKEREIWFCHLGLNIGHEQDGDVNKFLRPVAILKKISDEMFFGVPLTRTPRFGKEYFTIINDHGVGFAMLSQGRALDARRLKYYSAIIPEDEFESLKLRFLLNIL